MTSGGAPKCATVPDPTVQLGAAPSGPQRAGALHDQRSIRKQTKTRVQVCPFLPAAFRIPGNPGDGCKADRIVGGMTTRTVRSVTRAEKISLMDMAGTTPCGPQPGSKGNEYAGPKNPPHRQGLQKGLKSHTEGGKGEALVERKLECKKWRKALRKLRFRRSNVLHCKRAVNRARVGAKSRFRRPTTATRSTASRQLPGSGACPRAKRGHWLTPASSQHSGSPAALSYVPARPPSGRHGVGTKPSGVTNIRSTSMKSCASENRSGNVSCANPISVQICILIGCPRERARRGKKQIKTEIRAACGQWAAGREAARAPCSRYSRSRYRRLPGLNWKTDCPGQICDWS
jgi:hypothetical protein